MKLNLLPLLVTLIVAPVFAQDMAMPQVSETVSKYINASGINASNLNESCVNFEACGHMNYHVKTYKFKGEAKKAFELLVSLKPDEIWNTSSRFEMEYDPEERVFLGKEQQLPDIAKGQVFFLELDVTKKMQIPTSFKVVELDHENLTLSFSYLKQNKSNGIQRITFKQDGEKFKVVHESHFLSDSKLRDKVFYGPIHTMLLNDVWKSFEKRL